MKYAVLIMDGAAGLPIPDHAGKTSLEIARTPNLNALAKTGSVGLVKNVPPGMEPESAIACMSIFGYDPAKYYAGRAPVEAVSLGIAIEPGDVVFRCNLVTIQDGKMVSHSAGGISTEEGRELISYVGSKLGNDQIIFYPGVSYRGILKFKGYPETAEAVCTAPHDIPGKPFAENLPKGHGSKLLADLIAKSADILKDHPINKKRTDEGKLPATNIWIFWGSDKTSSMPSFEQQYKLKAAVTSGVSLLQGLGKMSGMALLNIEGVTDALDNDYVAQAEGAIEALKAYDIVFIHVEAPDEAGHAGLLKEKIEAIEKIDSAIVGALRKWKGGTLRILCSPDHPTPVQTRIHQPGSVPFLLWGEGIKPNGATRLTEKQAAKTCIVVDPGNSMMRRLIGE